MRIAIIGATGLLGHHTARSVLERGHALTVIHRESTDLSKIQDLAYDAAVADLDDTDSIRRALDGVDAVIYCAAYYPTVPRPWKQEVAEATGRMGRFYDACADLPLQKVVYLGSSIALPKNASGEPGHEGLDYPGEPPTRNSYVRVKWAMDRQARDRARQGLPVVIGIPTMTFGEYDFGPSTGTLLTKLANREIPGYVPGDRNVVYAGDAGRGLVLAVERGRPGERYFITGAQVSMDDLVALMARVAGVPVPRSIPLGVARMVARLQAARYKLFGGAAPVLSETAIAVMSGGQFISGEKAQKELDYQPTVDLDETIARTHRWFAEVGYVRRTGEA